MGCTASVHAEPLTYENLRSKVQTIEVLKTRLDETRMQIYNSNEKYSREESELRRKVSQLDFDARSAQTQNVIRWTKGGRLCSRITMR